jgi:hypothetical protein
MGIFRRLFGKNDGGEPAPPHKSEQAVIIYLDGTGLPDSVYQECDTSTLEDRLVQVVERDRLGEVDGTETGPTETALFMYASDAERLFAGVERTLRDYPLCQGARVVIRRGGPDSEQREVRL